MAVQAPSVYSPINYLSFIRCNLQTALIQFVWDIPDSLEAVAELYRSTHTQELEWIAGIPESDLARTIETPFLSGQTFSIAQGLMPVFLHTHGHRAQCATKLRQLGGALPALDYVAWLKDRSIADWSDSNERWSSVGI